MTGDEKLTEITESQSLCFQGVLLRAGYDTGALVRIVSIPLFSGRITAALDRVNDTVLAGVSIPLFSGRITARKSRLRVNCLRRVAP